MTGILTRTNGSLETKGKLTISDDNGNVIFSCLTLELPWFNNEHQKSCIPTGEYNVTKYNSPHLGPCYAVNNVPDRSDIRIHSGNWATPNPETGKVDTDGCILVGDKYDLMNQAAEAPEIADSRDTLTKMYSLVDEFDLTIV